MLLAEEIMKLVLNLKNIRVPVSGCGGCRGSHSG
jgi:hypothetical protein